MAKLISSICLAFLCLSVATVVLADADLVDVTVNSAQLNQEGNVFMKVYGINSPQPIPLPITKSGLNGSTYVEFSTPVQNNTQQPSWSNTYGFSNYFFSTTSIVAFELWNNTYDESNDVTFLGGAQFTIAEVQQMPQSNNIVLTNPSGFSPGYISITVQNGE